MNAGDRARAVCIKAGIRELQKQNATLRKELEDLRLQDRLRGLTSGYERLAIPVDDIIGTLKGFELGMTEHEVFERVSKAGGLTLESASTLTYTLEVRDWRAEHWGAGLEIHGGRLTGVWLHGLDCPATTWIELEADLRRRLGDPVPQKPPPSLGSGEMQAKLAALALAATNWVVPVLGVEVSLRAGTLTGAPDVMLAVRLRPT